VLYLKFRRLELGFTQRAVANRIGLNHSWLCQIERGRVNPTADELKRLGKVLGCPAERLFNHVSAGLLGEVFRGYPPEFGTPFRASRLLGFLSKFSSSRARSDASRRKEYLGSSANSGRCAFRERVQVMRYTGTGTVSQERAGTPIRPRGKQLDEAPSRASEIGPIADRYRIG
jgi:transcriptional regulator with XRE-family HTH domain